MAIAILKRAPGQTIPRPMSRASNPAEVLDLLPNLLPNLRNIDTEKPVAVDEAGNEFFAFREP